MTLSSDTTFGGTNPWSIDLYGAPPASATLQGNGYSLTKVGGNEVTFRGWTNNLTVNNVKNININAGTLSVLDDTTINNSQPGSIYVNSGGTLSVGNYGLGNPTIQKPIVMGGGVFQTDTTGTSGNAVIATNISLNSTGSFAPQSGSTLTFNGSVSDGTASNGISLNGPGVLLLTATDTYSGNTSVNAGTLRLGSNSAVPGGTGKGNVIVAVGATLDMNGMNAAINGLSGSGIIGNSSAASATLNLGNNNSSSTFSGLIQNSARRLTSSRTARER